MALAAEFLGLVSFVGFYLCCSCPAAPSLDLSLESGRVVVQSTTPSHKALGLCPSSAVGRWAGELPCGSQFSVKMGAIENVHKDERKTTGTVSGPHKQSTSVRCNSYDLQKVSTYGIFNSVQFPSHLPSLTFALCASSIPHWCLLTQPSLPHTVASTFSLFPCAYQSSLDLPAGPAC